METINLTMKEKSGAITIEERCLYVNVFTTCSRPYIEIERITDGEIERRVYYLDTLKWFYMTAI